MTGARGAHAGSRGDEIFYARGGQDPAQEGGAAGGLFSSLFMLSAASCVVLGGQAGNGGAANAVLQFLSLPLLASAIFFLATQRAAGPEGLRGVRPDAGPRVFLAAMALLPLLQLTPLPFALWSHLPMREKAVASVSAVGLPDVSAPLSLAPELGWLAFLSLIPPAAIFLGFLCLSARDRWRAIYCLIGLTILNDFLGLLQLAQGVDSPLRLYGADDEADGFFANRNHFAALNYAMVPFAGAILARAVADFGRDRETGLRDPASVAGLAAAIVIIVILIAAGVMSRSRAGVALLMASLVATAALPRWGGLMRPAGTREGFGAGRLFGAIAGLGLLFAMQYGLFRLLTRFEADPMDDARRTIAGVAWRGVVGAFPFGTGFGSFQQAYFALERPADVYPAVVNAAHNEYIQVLLEGGAAALILGGLFLVWFIRRSLCAWRAPFDPLTSPLRGAASVSIALLLAHSFVDYPVRTGALGCLFAIGCALLAGEGRVAASPGRGAGGRRRAVR